jgi:hypothetical protein
MYLLVHRQGRKGTAISKSVIGVRLVQEASEQYRGCLKRNNRANCLTGGRELGFDFLNWAFALDRNAETAQSSRLHADHFALACQAHTAAGLGYPHIHCEIYLGVKRDRIGSLQQHAADAHILAGRLNFSNTLTYGETQAHRQLKSKPAVSSLDGINLNQVFLRHGVMLGALDVAPPDGLRACPDGHVR